MYKLEVTSRTKEPVRKLMSEMKIGEIGRVVTHMYNGQVILRTYSAAVCLDNPTSDWLTGLQNHEVELLLPGTIITLEVK